MPPLTDYLRNVHLVCLRHSGAGSPARPAGICSRRESDPRESELTGLVTLGFDVGGHTAYNILVLSSVAAVDRRVGVRLHAY